MSGGPDPSSSADLSTGQLISQLSEQTSTLVRSELQLAKVELTNSAKHAGLGGDCSASLGSWPGSVWEP
jgi:Putative Actinobacterial Holin-X, holin superfamily III